MSATHLPTTELAVGAPRGWSVASLVAPATLFVAIGLLIPIAILFRYSLNAFVPGKFMVEAVTLDNYIRFFTDPFYLNVLWRTVRVAFATTLICLVLGFPLAYVLARMQSRWKNLMVMLVVLPLFVGNAVRAAGWMVAFGSKGFINAGLMGAGVISEPIQLMYTEMAVIIGIAAVNLPFMVLTLSSVIEGIDRAVEEAAFSLGAGPWAMFRRILAPLAMPGILAGTILTFILALAGKMMIKDKLTRGGPTTVRPGISSLGLVATSDARRHFWVSAQAQLSNREFGGRSRQYGATLNLRPWTALTLSATPTYLRAHTVAQYLSTVPDPTATATCDARYVFGSLDQDEASIPLRVNLVLSPKLSLQVYTQALLSTGAYPEIRQLAAPRTYDFPVYGVDVGTIERDPELPLYVIDPDGAGAARPFRIPVPDFNFKSLRVNAVLRWEFRPGSAAYVVWTQRRQNGANPGDHAFGRDLGDLFAAPADDVFMVKLAWWLGR